MMYVTQFVIHIIFLWDSAGLEQWGSMETTADHKADAFCKALKLKIKEKKTTHQIPLTSHWFVIKDFFFFLKRGGAPIVLWLT